MHDKYRVKLPKWVFNPSDEQEQESLIKRYMQRYPHYFVIQVENGFAICERIKS